MEISTVFKSAVVSDEEMYETIQRGAFWLPTVSADSDRDRGVGRRRRCRRRRLGARRRRFSSEQISRRHPRLYASSNGASHPTVEAMVCSIAVERSLEELERSLRRDIAALTNSARPVPSPSSALLSSEEYERIYLSTFVKTHKTVAGPRWTTLLTVVVALVAVWAKTTSRRAPRRRRRSPPKPPPKPPTPNVDDSPTSNAASIDARKRAARDEKSSTTRVTDADALRRRPRPCARHARDRRERVRRTPRSRAKHSAILE